MLPGALITKEKAEEISELIKTVKSTSQGRKDVPDDAIALAKLQTAGFKVDERTFLTACTGIAKRAGIANRAGGGVTDESLIEALDVVIAEGLMIRNDDGTLETTGNFINGFEEVPDDFLFGTLDSLSKSPPEGSSSRNPKDPIVGAFIGCICLCVIFAHI